MAYALDETIVALASANGGAARSIVRIAGPEVAGCLDACFQAEPAVRWAELPVAQVVAGQIQLDGLAARLPCDLYYWPDERSYTRSPMAEIHTLGSPPLADALLRTLSCHGARLAEPGEFTLRAFLGGRLDLTQAEAVLGVIDADAEGQLQVALAQLAGGLSQPLTEIRDTLLELLAHLEAGLDFVEEEIEFISREQLLSQLDGAQRQIDQLATQMQSRSESAASACAVLLGAPNVGKSSLFNALAEGEQAIVSQQAGTTRDYLTTEIEVEGIRCQLVDTAGLEMPGALSGDDEDVAAAAQAVTDDQRQTAQLQLLCFDATHPLTEQERAMLRAADADTSLIVLTKCDLAGEPSVMTGQLATVGQLAEGWTSIETSGLTRTGLDELRRAMAAKISAENAETNVVATTALRCHDSLHRAAEALSAARRLADAAAGEELVAIELRTALDELGRVTGAVYTDDILDRIFGRFCIGK